MLTNCAGCGSESPSWPVYGNHRGLWLALAGTWLGFCGHDCMETVCMLHNGFLGWPIYAGEYGHWNGVRIIEDYDD